MSRSREQQPRAKRNGECWTGWNGGVESASEGMRVDASTVRSDANGWSHGVRSMGCFRMGIGWEGRGIRVNSCASVVADANRSIA